MKHSSLLSIKTFSEFTGVNQSTLRYYDKIGLLSPAERGENNYRYYTPFQSVTLSFINVLSSLGIPLSTIKEMAEHRSPEHILDLLAQQEYSLDKQLNELNTAYSIVHIFRSNIQSGLQARENDISVQRLEETKIIFGQTNEFDQDRTYYDAFMKFCRSAHRYGIDLRYPIGGYHFNMDEFLERPGQPNKFFSFDPTGNSVTKAGDYLVGYYRDFYGEFGDFPEKMRDYAQAHSLTLGGPVYTVYLLDSVSVQDPKQYLSQVYMPLLGEESGE